MRKFSIRIQDLDIFYDHYLSDKFIKEEGCGYDFNWSRGFDKPAIRYKSGACVWCLDGEYHRVGKPAWIGSNGRVWYYENGKVVK